MAHVGLRSTTDESRCRGPTTSRRMNPAILHACAIADDARQVQAFLRPCCCVECCCLAPTHLVVQPAHVSAWSLIAADLRRTRDIATALMRRLVQLNAILRVGFYVGALATPHAPQDDGEPMGVTEASTSDIRCEAMLELTGNQDRGTVHQLPPAGDSPSAIRIRHARNARQAARTARRSVKGETVHAVPSIR